MKRANPILDFGIDKAAIQYIGRDLQRPECILAERDGIDMLSLTPFQELGSFGIG